MIERLLLVALPPGARILDVCCGTGTVAQELVSRGFKVTGIDVSEQMLRYASKDVPKAVFLVADARDFHFPSIFDAALCTFDSLSYILQLDELERVFSNIHAALRPGGVFLFDLSLEDVYRSEWRQSCTIIEDDEAFFIRGYYDERERRGKTLITAFQRNDSWERTDVVFVVRSHAPEEILNTLTQAGFTECVCQRSDEDNKLRNDLGPGRACYVARTR